MSKRPLHLAAVAGLFLLFPLEFLWRANQVGTWEWPDFVISVVLPIALATSLWRVTRLAWFALFGVLLLWSIRDLYFVQAASGAGLLAFLGHLGIYGLSLAYFLQPRVRVLYFDPQARWWNTKPRYSVSLPAIIETTGTSYYPLMKNLSDGGCFVELKTQTIPDALLTVRVPLPEPYAEGSTSVLELQGEIRWVNRQEGTHGYGIQFLRCPRAMRRALLQVIERTAA